MKTSISSQECSRRAALIRQAIARGAGRFFGGAKLLYPISDYILLAFQEPTCLSIWDRSDKLIFSTFRDPDIVSSTSLSTGDHLKSTDRCKIELSHIGPHLSDYYVTIHKVSESGFVPMNAKGIALVKQILDPNKEPRFPDGFSEALIEAIETNSKSTWVDSTCRNAIVLSDDHVAMQLEPLRTVLDEVMSELLEHKSFSVTLSNGASIPNLFAVIRTVRSTQNRFSEKESEGVFPYTASLLLSNVQRDLLSRICDDSGCSACNGTTRANCQEKQYMNRCISQLEAPLSLTARSIFDSVYYSGCIDYGLLGKTGEAGHWRDRGGAREDVLRREVERCVYGVLTRGHSSRIMYVPIHVGGSPWISLFTFTRAKENSAWDDNYCFYRDVVAKLSDRIRSAIKDSYIASLIDALIQSLQSHSTDLFKTINDRWHVASQIFPFRHHRLEQCASTTHCALSLPKGIHGILIEEDNAFCHGQIDYGHIILDKLRSTIDRELRLFERIELLASDQLFNRVESQAHTLLSIIPKGSLKLALRAQDMPTLINHVKDAAANTEILEAALLIALKRKLPERFPEDIDGMLRWLHERVTSQKVIPTLQVNKVGVHVIVPTENVPAAFTVLWNLWDNAEKAAGGTTGRAFHVHTIVDVTTKQMQIEFVNSGEMAEPWQRYLGDKAPYPSDETRQRGLMFVKDLLPKLGWVLEPPIVSDGQTCIRLIIKHIEGQSPR